LVTNYHLVFLLYGTIESNVSGGHRE